MRCLPILLALTPAALAQDWTVLELKDGSADQGSARFETLADGIVRVNGSGDIARYRLEFRTRQSDIRGLKIEALPDDALPKKGPGRSANGNFVLSEVRVRTAVGRNSRAVEVVGASASFSQVGWPAEASIDGRESTGWAVSGAIGKASELVLEFDEALGDGERRIVLDFDFAYGDAHSIGKLRVSATSSEGKLLAAGVEKGLGELRSQINKSIDRGVNWLMSQQELDGSWANDQGHYPAGTTALCAYALVKSGVDSEHQAIRRALAYLDAHPPIKTYSAGCALLLYAAIADAGAKARAELVLADLLDWQVGDWGYPGGHSDPTSAAKDLSNTQYGALGLWAAQKLELHVPQVAWERLADKTMRYQAGGDEEGSGRGFSYRPGGGATGSMTAAGVAVLKLCEPHVSSDLDREVSAMVERGLEWLDTHFKPNENTNAGQSWLEYYLYGIERVGAFCERTEFNRQDWYLQGARGLVTSQRDSGKWDRGRPQATTSFALLFLNRATSATTGPGAGQRAATYGADDPAVAVNMRAAGDTPMSIWVSSFGDEILESWTFEGEEEQGPRIALVDYLTDGGVILPDSRDGGGEWRYTTKAPDEGWAQPDFDDRKWRKGLSGFGPADGSRLPIGTDWTSKELWLRAELDLDLDRLIEPHMEISFGSADDSAGGPSDDIVKLYDEEQSFAKALNGGPGKVEQVSGDAASGESYLRVTGQQRYQAKIPGWGFAIREDPEEGEFRYLQFAWRKRDGGVMVQLAIDGAWGRAQRYYAGDNVVKFEPAHKVGRRMPARWDTVTVDLWQDLGGNGFLTGISLTPMSGSADFDGIYVSRTRSALGRSDRLVDSAVKWGVTEASAKMIGEEAVTLWINGKAIEALDYETPGFETWLNTDELLPLLVDGPNHIALHVKNEGGARSFDLSIRDAERLARVMGNPNAPSRGNRFAARHRFNRPGQYPVRARVHVVDEASGEVEIFESKPLNLTVREALAPEMLDYADHAIANLIPDGLSEAKASSEVSAFPAANAFDGKQYQGWLCSEGDARPSLTVELRRPVKADTILLSPLRPDRQRGGSAPARVEIIVNGKGDPIPLNIPASHLEKAVLRFDKSQKIRSFEVRIVERTGSGSGLPPVGFAEVELIYDGSKR